MGVGIFIKVFFNLKLNICYCWKNILNMYMFIVDKLEDIEKYKNSYKNYLVLIGRDSY